MLQKLFTSFLLLFLIVFLCHTSYAIENYQQLDSIPKFDLDKYKEKFKALKKYSSTGAIKLNTEINLDTSINTNYTISINSQSSFAGINIPINFNYSNGKSIYNYQLNTVKLPSYNRIGISPSYKNLTAHIGYRSLTYSENSLNGHQFKGAGIEYEGELVYASLFTGNLVRSTISQLSLLGNIDAPFKRKAWGLKFGLTANESNDHLSMIVLKVNDHFSVNQLSTLPESIRPAENAILALLTKKELFDKLFLVNEYHFSAHNQNTNEERINIPTGATAYNLFGLFTKRPGSTYGHSMKSQLIYKLEKSEFSINNTYIAPDFISLGSLNFQNNLNNTTFGNRTSFFNEKLKLNSEIGFQLTGLRENENSKKRIILKTNSTYQLNESTSLNFSIANFSNQSRVLYTQAASANIDSLSLVNDNFTTSAGIQKTLNKENQSSIGIIASYSNSSTITNDIIDDSQRNRIYVLSTNYNISLSEKSKFQSNASYSYLQNSFINTHVITPNTSLSYQFSERINNNSTVGLSYVINNTNTLNLNISDSVDWIISKKQKMQMSLSGIYRITQDNQGVPFLLVANCNYAYNF